VDFGKGTQVIEGRIPKREALFIDLITELDRINEISRFRISSIEPNLCTDGIIDFVASSNRFMPHFHMPLQSGNNEVLAMMRRRYQRELYAHKVQRIKDAMPHACIGVDVITGFPGETDAHFMDTYHFLSDLPISYIHAFTYSERENTPAATMTGIVPVNVRRERSHMLRKLSGEKKIMHYHEHIGQTRNVLIEQGPQSGKLSGFTDNYIRVLMNEGDAEINSIKPLFLENVLIENAEPFMAVRKLLNVNC
jgi:threonylcarbamoyladenosine tRNA methylthiotransferase MtaB